jgi:hypothetical protein
MKWNKRGLIPAPDRSFPWAVHSALTPTPWLVDDRTIRIYAGFRDESGVSRIGFLEVDAADPSAIKYIAPTPALDVGAPGTFDDNGVILGDVVPDGASLRLYYVGFQLARGVKFLAFTGLATSEDGGRTFQRHGDAPILDKANGERYIRTIHSVRREAGEWRAWYAAGDGWAEIDGRPYPRYDIRSLTSPDGATFTGPGRPCVTLRDNEYRIGRPRVYRFDERYLMFYTRGTLAGDYVAGYAESSDGVSWTRRDEDIGIAPSATGWDSQSLCYPALLQWRDRIYLFYNGNDMGRAGVGYAILEAW